MSNNKYLEPHMNVIVDQTHFRTIEGPKTQKAFETLIGYIFLFLLNMSDFE